MPFTYWVLFADLFVLGMTLALRTRAWAVALLITSAVWLPANNKVLEGHVLWTVSHTHGLTESDLLGIAGILIAAAVLVHASGATSGPGRREAIVRIAAVSATTLVAGFVAAFIRG